MRVFIFFIGLVLTGCAAVGPTDSRIYKGMSLNSLKSLTEFSAISSDPFLNREDWVYFKKNVKIVGSDEGPTFYVFKNDYLSSWHETKRAAYDAVNRLINPKPIQRERRELKGDSSKQENRSRKKARQPIQID